LSPCSLPKVFSKFQQLFPPTEDRECVVGDRAAPLRSHDRSGRIGQIVYDRAGAGSARFARGVGARRGFAQWLQPQRPLACGAARGVNPVRILKVIEGAWHDSCLMDHVDLLANGPIYLMDRGFYAIDLVARWTARRVRFIVRGKYTHLRYEVQWTIGLPRKIG